MVFVVFLFFKQKTAYEIRISDWSSDVCSSDLGSARLQRLGVEAATSETANQILAKAVDYVDRQMKDDYDYLVKNKMDLSKRHMRYTHVHYLYIDRKSVV